MDVNERRRYRRMKHNISSANLMVAMYFMGLSAQYSMEKNSHQITSVEESDKDVSPEQFVGLLKEDAIAETKEMIN